MCAESQHLSLLGVLGLLTTLLISYLTRRANLPSTPEFLDTLWLGSLSRSTPVWFLYGIHIAKYFFPINGLPPRHASNLLSMEPLVLGFLPTLVACWVEAYGNDSVCFAIRNLVLNPGETCKATLSEVHYAYCQPLHQSHIVIEGKMLILREPICGSTSKRATRSSPRSSVTSYLSLFTPFPLEGI